MVDLDEPRLTHVVVDKRDESRRLELIKRTAKYVACLSPFSWVKSVGADVQLAQAEAAPSRHF